MRTLKQFPSVTDAELAQVELGAAEIESWILDESSATVGLGAAALGVRLGVADADFGRACEVLGATPDRQERKAEEPAQPSKAEQVMLAIMRQAPVVALVVAGVFLLGSGLESIAEAQRVPPLYVWFGAAVLGLLGTITYYLARIAARM